MPSMYDIKPKFQALLRPITGRLARAGVTANQVTVSAMILSVAAGAAIYATGGAHWSLLAIPVTLFVRMALNAIDGMLAREHGMKSAKGAVLNEVGDVVSDSALYLPFAVIAGVSAPLIVVIVVLSVISEMTGVVGVQIGGDRRYDGPMGKSDRAFVLGLLALLLGVGIGAGKWTTIYLAVIVALLVWTILNRARMAVRSVSAVK